MKNVIALALLVSIFFYACSLSPSDHHRHTSYYTSPGGFEQGYSGDQYHQLPEGAFIETNANAVSTFSIDADGASYANVRRFILEHNQRPPKEAVRTEEMLNYFNLDYRFEGLSENTSQPIAIQTELSACPWQEEHQLLRVGIKGKPLEEGNRPSSNFVFLIDASGSMQSRDKLKLLKKGFVRFAATLQPSDRIAIVTYAGTAGVVLESTSGKHKKKIIKAIGTIGAGGSTAGAEGIRTAYSIARDNFIEDGNNRVILGSDGDFNVGISNTEALISFIEEERESGIFLTVLGVGRGNLNDHMMEQIANHGNGTYEYIDSPKQLDKVFRGDAGNFYTVAKDVKVQLNFNPEAVQSYRLIGYENRMLAEIDFEDDKKDAGEIGAGQDITALYEIVPTKKAAVDRVGTIDFRYKHPQEQNSLAIRHEVLGQASTFAGASDQQKWCAGVASFSLLLRESEYSGTASFSDILEWTASTELPDEGGFKSEFRELVGLMEKF